ncbi:ankyrin repeat protein [Moumouvirus australiensis]|uniref:Ankyrin repeat protein n=1 Tax=Moumouvirus australiensis TaxID=2109587 RepID=A0A2P1EKN8_9VIRU|nr:ankyrin repeat protein [Moumouvirus australiensis]AVL94462.1 ankyrin repeat protein [Moumouvirus australiensis]
MKSIIEINNSYSNNKIYPCEEGINCSGFTKLMYLVINEKNMFKGYEVIKKYLKNNKNKIDYQNDLGYTALMLAVINYPKKTSLKTINLLLKFEPCVTTGNYDGYDVMCLAIKNFNVHENLNLIKLLLKYDNEFFDSCFDKVEYPILYDIIKNINISILRLILDNISDINKKINYNQTYISCAIVTQNNRLIRELIKRGCDLTLNYDGGHNLLHFCAKNNFYDIYIIKCIINAGCDVNKINENGLSPLMTICKNTKTMPGLEIDIAKVISFVNLLLENGADINLQNEDRALTFLCKYNNKYSRKIIKILINKGVELDYDTHDTPLIIASSYSKGNNKIVKLLLESGADINYYNPSACHALMYACRYAGTTSHISTVKLLLDSGADINSIDYKGQTALMYASKYSHASSHDDVISLLLDYGADINIISHKKKNALLLSCEVYKTYSNISTILLLLSYGSDYLITGKYDRTFFSFVKGDELFTCFEVIKVIENTKSCLKKTLKQFMQVIENKFYDPNGFRIKLLNLKWNLESNNMDKIITWENLELMDYYNIYDLESAKIKIFDNTKYMF